MINDSVAANGAIKRNRYKFAKLKVGQSKDIPDKTPSAISGSRRHAEMMTGFTFKAERVGNGCRIVRVK